MEHPVFFKLSSRPSLSWSDSPRLGQDGDTAYSETLPPLGPRREVRFLSGFVPPERSIDDQRQQKVETKRNPHLSPMAEKRPPLFGP